MNARLRIAVLDYGSGNLHSVCRALDVAGAQVELSSAEGSATNTITACDGLVVPGVGAFAACMAGLRAVGGVELIQDWWAARRPLLGICVGHQVLFAAGTEYSENAQSSTPGVGVLPGVVEKLHAIRLPHLGWDTVQPPSDSAMFAGLAGERFYFVHSYAVRELPAVSELSDVAVTWAEHEAERFVAAVEAGARWSTQFHPEKSGAAGARLLQNWLARVGEHRESANTNDTKRGR
ncbi:MAG: imidazole glycerol phosphate synthase subunit HisH [Propionibacteriaceae bacterium]|nr:imidazole glycerol phosphate synthase subunit HisH [Propionibacteriaceae bacterium]